MKSLLAEIKAEFPDMQEADIIRVLLFVGFSPEDLDRGKIYTEIKGAQIIVPRAFLDNELKQQKNQYNGQ